MITKYGVTSPIKHSTIAEKIKATNIERYGVDNPSKNLEIKEKIRDSSRSAFLSNLIKRLEPHDIIPVGEFIDVWSHNNWKCLNCSTNFTGTALNGRVPRCLTCYPSFISIPQKEINDYIVELIGSDQVSLNDRVCLQDDLDKRKSKELDIFIKSKNFAIEYCGLRWQVS